MRPVFRRLIFLIPIALVSLAIGCGHPAEVNNPPGSGFTPGPGGNGGKGGGTNPGSLTVTAIDPPADAVGVPPETSIVASFNNPIAPGTANTTSFLITDDAGAPVIGSVSVNVRNATFKPSTALAGATLYHVKLTTAIQDANAGSLAADFDWSFTTSKNTWTPTSTTMSPGARFGHTAVWTGTEMIVWGGTDGSNILATGARYDPSQPDAGAWKATASTSSAMVLGRTDHTAIWTGKAMIVWGGDLGGGLGPTNTGARYDPANNTWTAIPTPAPSASILPRSLHTAVWTGKEMIVWGGIDTGPSPTETGGRFDPSITPPTSANWKPTSTGSDAPAARVGHTAVWTGTEMIVWGGIDSGGFPLNSGARYKPTTNTWSKTNPSGAPLARSGHTAIWTGKAMIVWGGDLGGGLGPTNSGASYDPVADIWTPIANAPIARSDHKAVWTGTEMIVWGGGASMNSGAAYDPAHDTWRPISTTGAPTARSGHTAVWSGTEMIVWGGIDSAVTGTGGRYAP